MLTLRYADMGQLAVDEQVETDLMTPTLEDIILSEVEEMLGGCTPTERRAVRCLIGHGEDDPQRIAMRLESNRDWLAR